MSSVNKPGMTNAEVDTFVQKLVEKDRAAQDFGERIYNGDLTGKSGQGVADAHAQFQADQKARDAEIDAQVSGYKKV